MLPIELDIHYCVLDVASGRMLYPALGRRGTDLVSAATALIHGSVYGKGATAREARVAAGNQRRKAYANYIRRANADGTLNLLKLEDRLDHAENVRRKWRS